MKERPILFSGAMVRAILEGRKTQTRRLAKYIPALGRPEDWCHKFGCGFDPIAGNVDYWCPYGQIGDRLWVRETWAIGDRDNDVLYAADPSWNVDGVAVPPPVNKGTVHAGNWRPSIHMPRWASRIALEVTGVRVERLNMITAGDAEAEGVDASTCGNIEEYQRLWDSINTKRGYEWAKNPWVWVVEFRKGGAV
jgi:hypothetical protein